MTAITAMPPISVSALASFSLFRGRCMRWESQFQRNIMGWYKAGVHATCDAMGVEEAAPKYRAQRSGHHVGRIFNQSSLNMAKGSLRFVVFSMPLSAIYSDTISESHVQWQRYIKTVFLWTAEDVFKYTLLQIGLSISAHHWMKSNLVQRSTTKA